MKTKDYTITVTDQQNEYEFSAKNKDTIYIKGIEQNDLDRFNFKILDNKLIFQAGEKVFNVLDYEGIQNIKTDNETTQKTDLLNIILNVDIDNTQNIINVLAKPYYNAKKLTVTGTNYCDVIDYSNAGYHPTGKNLKYNKGLTINGGYGHDSITGTEYNDVLAGGSGFDALDGGEGNDIITGSWGNDTITGGLGNDTITGGEGENLINYSKGDGNDVIYLSKSENFTLNISGTGIYTYEDLEFKYANNNKDLRIYTDENEYITLKNFIAKDITNNATKNNDNTSSVVLIIGDNKYDLRQSLDITNYNNPIKIDLYKHLLNQDAKSFTGSWLDDYVDAQNVEQKYSRGKALSTGVSIKTGEGDDVIIGSDFNDTITGGFGINTIKYTNTNFGTDTINLTKNEELILDFTDCADISNLSDLKYGISGNNLIITCSDEDKIILKNYTKNILKSLSINVYNQELHTFNNLEDLAGSITFDFNNAFLNKKNVLTGTNYNDRIDITNETNKKYTINAGDGTNNITVTGGKNVINAGISTDTINISEEGNYTINAGAGTNTINIDNTDSFGIITINEQKVGAINNIIFSDELSNPDFKILGNDLKITDDNGQVLIKNYNANLNNKATFNISVDGEMSSLADYLSKETLYITGSKNINGTDNPDIITISGKSAATINAGKGDDTINYSKGNRTFYFAEGDGNDYIESGGGVDTFRFAAGTEVRPEIQYDFDEKQQLVFYYGTQGDSVTLSKYKNNVCYYIGNKKYTVNSVTKKGENLKITDYMTHEYKGTEFNDTIIDSFLHAIESPITIYSDDGNDSIDAHHDYVYAGKGNDTVHAINSYVDGEEGNDIIINYGGGSIPDIIIEGGAGNDLISNERNALAKYLKGDEGHDKIINKRDAHVNYIYGDDGNDTIVNDGIVNNNIEGGSGNDSITISNALNNTVHNNVDGGSGNDTITIYGNVNNNVEGGSGNDSITISGYVKEQIHGGDDNDTITLYADNDNNYSIYGDNGNDVINIHGSGTGSVNAYGGIGNDFFNIYSKNLILNVEGGSGNDTFTVYGNANSVLGGLNDDNIIIKKDANVNAANGQEGDDTYTFESGFGTVNLTDVTGSNILEFKNIALSDLIFTAEGYEKQILKITEKNNKNGLISINDTNLDHYVTVKALNENGVLTEYSMATDIKFSGSTTVSTWGDDTLTSISSYGFNGEMGNDVLINNDTINGSNGTRIILDGDEGNDIIINNGIINGNVVYACLNGGDGDDTIVNNGIINDGFITGTNGNNTIITKSGSSCPYILVYSGARDTLDLNASNNIIRFNINSTISSNHCSWEENDLVVTPNDNYYVVIKNYNPTDENVNVYFETYTGSYSGFQQVNLSTITPERTINGTNNDDNIILAENAYSTNIYGLDGNDTITNNGTVKTSINAGDGNDIIINQISGSTTNINGSGGNDNITNYGTVTGYIKGGVGNDTITTTAGSYAEQIKFASGDGNDTLYLNAYVNNLVFPSASEYKYYSILGNDLRIGYNADTDSVLIKNYNNVNFNIDSINPEQIVFGDENNDTITNEDNIAFIYGYDGNDSITNNDTVEYIYGGNGNDTITTIEDSTTRIIKGGADDDVITNNGNIISSIYGDNGNDSITNTDGGSLSMIYAGSGNDTIVNYGYISGTVSLDSGNNTFINNNTIMYDIRFNVEGGTGADIITNNGKMGRIIGGTGNDTITTESNSSAYSIEFSDNDGNDTLYLDAQNNKLIFKPWTNITCNWVDNDVVISYGNNNSVTIKNYVKKRLHHIQSGGYKWYVTVTITANGYNETNLDDIIPDRPAAPQMMMSSPMMSMNELNSHIAAFSSNNDSTLISDNPTQNQNDIPTLIAEYS